MPRAGNGHSFDRVRITIPSTTVALALLATGLVSCSTTGHDPATPEPDTALSEAAAAVDRNLTELVSSGALVGGEAVLRQGTELIDLTAGLADADMGTPYPEGSHTRIASVTKVFTSAMILQLVDEGSVGLDDPVEDHLPGLLDGEGIEPDRITVRQLLRHESGLPEGIPPTDPTTVLTPRELMDRTEDQPAQFPPGEQMRYTNMNYLVLGYLIEEVTGEPYAEELNRRIVEPLGLTGTLLPEPGDVTLPAPAPRGHRAGDDGWTDVTEQEPSQLYASGGIVSTGDDLDRFVLALSAGEIVPPELLTEMRETVPMPDVPGVEYGLGLMRLPVSCDVTVWGQAGDVPGFQTMVGTDGDRAIGIQFDQGAGAELGPEQLLGLLDAAFCPA